MKPKKKAPARKPKRKKAVECTIEDLYLKIEELQVKIDFIYNFMKSLEDMNDYN